MVWSYFLHELSKGEGSVREPVVITQGDDRGLWSSGKVAME